MGGRAAQQRSIPFEVPALQREVAGSWVLQSVPEGDDLERRHSGITGIRHARAVLPALDIRRFFQISLGTLRRWIGPGGLLHFIDRDSLDGLDLQDLFLAPKVYLECLVQVDGGVLSHGQKLEG